ncbi:MAG TPA: FtsX-like permease family protein [Tissierellaceae bacterium]|nr:FtsX-like permease family protein [Tissierellaceae bacterium]
MKKPLWKDFFREIRGSFSRFISIFAIVFIGVAFFSGIKATAPDMKYSMDKYYDQYNLMDIRVMSTLGLTDNDIREIEKCDGVLNVQPGYFTDVVSTIDSTEFVIKIHSIPPVKAGNSGDEPINQIKLTEGRYPKNTGECIIEDLNLLNLGLKVGDSLKVSSGKTEDILKGTLDINEFTIVGKAITPYYLSYEKGASEIGSGKVNFFMMILEEDFAFPVYTEAVVTVKGARELNSYDKEYKELVSNTAVPIENIGVDRSVLRLEEIKEQAQGELEKAKNEYNEQKELFDSEMSAAEEELNQAQVELVEGETELETERKNFESNYKQASLQIADGEKKLAKAEIEYAQALKEYNATMDKYGEDLEKLDSATNQINEQRAEADVRLKELREKLKDPNLTEEERQDTQELIKNYEGFLSFADQGVTAVNDLNNLGQGQVNNAKQQLSNARSELDSQSAQLTKAKKDLESGKNQAYAEFSSAEKKLASGRKEYEAGKAEYEKQKEDGQKKLDEGREQIIRAENEIERLSKPQWYVLDRDSHYSFVDYGKTADRIDAIAKIFPVFFFLVASLVCLTTMTRMVDEQRGVIGTYKALGYGNKDIVLKYILYAATASLLGGALGLLFGMRIFPEVIYNAWSMMYTLPEFKQTVHISLMIISLLVGILVTTISAWGACYRELKETPALLLRPKAPKSGKKIFLEKIDGIWSRLSFSHKVTARNIFRYKKRFYMTIIGIAGCAALLLAGFGLSDSIMQVVEKQYNEIFTYDLNMKYTAIASEEEQTRVMKTLDQNSDVDAYEMSSEFNAKVKSDGEDISTTLIIPKDIESFKEYITLRERSNQNSIDIPDKGIIITEKLAKELKVGIGDTIEMDNGDGARKKLEISEITENYIFHYAYMSADYYKEIFRLAPRVNNLMIKLLDTSPSVENELGSTLIKDTGVASVLFFSNAKSTFNDTVTILNSIVALIIISAGLLAFVVLYNLTNINISERIREIATIKVLGFYNSEVASYVYRENVLLSMMGAGGGLFIGIILHRFIMIAVEQDGVMFGYHIEAISFLYAFIITMIFVTLVNIFMYKRLKNVHMVESLKSVE